jgi:hypothetical protein
VVADAYLTTPRSAPALWGFCSISEHTREWALDLVAKAEGR